MQLINISKNIFDNIFSSVGKQFILCFSFLACLTFFSSIILTNNCFAVTIEENIKMVFKKSHQTSIGTLQGGFTLIKGSEIEVDSSGNPNIVFGYIVVASDQAFEIGEGDIKISEKGFVSADNELQSPYITFLQDKKSGKWLATNGPLIFDPSPKILNNSIIKIIGGHENPIQISGKLFYDTTITFKDGNLKIIGTETQLESTLGAKDVDQASLNIQPKTLLPSFNAELKGNREVRIKNPNNFKVLVGLRSGNQGKDFKVASNGVSSVLIPDGTYQIFFVYSNKPDALFQGDDFVLNNNGVEIQIVKVVGGNYGIKQVK